MTTLTLRPAGDAADEPNEALDRLMETFREAKTAVAAMGDAAERIRQNWKGGIPSTDAADLAAAEVHIARLEFTHSQQVAKLGRRIAELEAALRSAGGAFEHFLIQRMGNNSAMVISKGEIEAIERAFANIRVALAPKGDDDAR